MGNGRITALVIAFIAAILVVAAGKSCADDAIRQNERSRNAKNITPTLNFSQGTLPPVTYADASPYEEPSEEIMYEEVTNMFGDVVETIPVTKAANIDTVETATATKSILEAYNEQHKKTNEEAATTEEAETTIYIEPATNIVIELN